MSIKTEIELIQENYKAQIKRLHEKMREDIDQCLKDHYTPSTKPKTVMGEIQEKKRNRLRFSDNPYESFEEAIADYIRYCNLPPSPVSSGHEILRTLYRAYRPERVKARLLSLGY